MKRMIEKDKDFMKQHKPPTNIGESFLKFRPVMVWRFVKFFTYHVLYFFMGIFIVPLIIAVEGKV
jgi:hypothetical protein